MPIITNEYNLSKSMYNALVGSDYDLKPVPNIISVTQLCAPPKFKVLQERHDHEVKEDASEFVYRLQGEAIHAYIHKCNKQLLGFPEERFFMDIDSKEVHTCGDREKPVDAKWYKKDRRYVSGRWDNLDEDFILEDYKYTSVYSCLYNPEGKPEEIAQVNINGLAVKLMGFPLNGLRITQILRDWVKTKQFTNPDYPEIQINEISVGIWPEEDTLSYIHKRFKLFENARRFEDDQIPECTPEERWARAGSYKVMKGNNVKAIRGGVYGESEMDKRMAHEKAEALSESTKVKHWVKFVAGKNGRCEDYCKYNVFCNWYQKQLIEGIK